MSNYLDNLVIKLLEDGYEFDEIMEITKESQDDEEVIIKLKQKRLIEKPSDPPNISNHLSDIDNKSEQIDNQRNKIISSVDEEKQIKEIEEKVNKERQEKVNRERQEKINIERQEKLNREREEKLNREREEKFNREREEKLKREREEKLKKEREEKLKKEREDRLNKDDSKPENIKNKSEEIKNLREINNNGLKCIRKNIPDCPSKEKLKYYNFDAVNQIKIKSPVLKAPGADRLHLKAYNFFESSEPYKASKIYQYFLKEEQVIESGKKPEPRSNQSSKIFSSKASEIYAYLISNKVPTNLAKSLAESSNSKEEALKRFISSGQKPNIPSINTGLSLSRTNSSQFSLSRDSQRFSKKPEQPLEKLDPNIIYYESLSNLRIFACTNFQAFKFYSFAKTFNMSAHGLKILNDEFAELKNSLPCSLSMSAFFMYDYEDACKIKALISGPENTVYAHGLYLFDICIPENYPSEPPIVSFMTTADGYFVFNPCFLGNGQVRLPNANTFNNFCSMRWNPKISTLMDLFLSIQEVLSNNNIIQHEPGFEKLALDSPENILYQYEVLYGNFQYAIIKNLVSPPVGFENIVKKHFTLKKDSIIKMANDLVSNINQNKLIKGIKSKNPQIQAALEHDLKKVFKKIAFKLDEVLNNKCEEA